MENAWCNIPANHPPGKYYMQLLAPMNITINILSYILTDPQMSDETGCHCISTACPIPRRS